jgi:lantibiotic biosynthesis protein
MTHASFRHAGPVALRTPALPTAALRGLYASGDSRRALHALLASDAEVRALIRLSSASLDRAVERWVRGDPDDDRGAALGALGYVARCSTRATPFGACAAVGFVSTSASSQARPRVVASPVRRTRPDQGWLNDLAVKLEGDDETFGRLRLRRSGLTYFAHGRLEVADVARSMMASVGPRDSAVTAPTALNFTGAVKTALDACTPGITAGELAARIARDLGAPRAAAAALVRKLVELGLLHTELRAPLTGDPAEFVAGVLARVAPATATRYAEFRDLLRAADTATAGSAADTLSQASAVAEALAESEHYWQIDATRRYAGAVPDSVLDDVAAVLGTLACISAADDENRALARLFTEQYNLGREVSVLELLDLSSGFAFERALAERDQESRRRDVALLSIAATALAAGESVILDDAAVERLAVRREPGVHPSSVEVICHIGERDGTLRVLMLNNGHSARYDSLARFHDVLELPPERSRSADGGVLEAELVVLPHYRRAANVAVRRHDSPYEIVAGVWPAVPDDRVLTLDDLVVGVRNGRMYIRSRSLGAIVHVNQTHLLNLDKLSRIGRFFDAVAAPDLRYVSFRWGELAAALPCVPRVLAHGVIVSPKAWRLPAALALEFQGPAAAYWRSAWQLPDVVYLVDYDNRLLLDLRHHLCRQHLARHAKKIGADGVLVLEEAVPQFGEEPVTGSDGAYFAELAARFEAVFPESLGAHHVSGTASALSGSRDVALRAPGSEWTYVKLYVGRQRMSYFVESHVARLVAELGALASDFHFVRYADPQDHVRVRFRAADGIGAALMRRVVERVGEMVRTGLIDRASYDVYDREVERYGGAAAIAAAERVFTASSKCVLDALPALRRGAQPEEVLLAEVAAFALAACGSAEAASALFRASLERRSRLTGQQWSAVRAALVALAGNAERYARVADATAAWTALVDERDVPGGLRALIHMHCNRLGLLPEEEAVQLHLAWALVDCALASPRGEAQRGDAFAVS